MTLEIPSNFVGMNMIVITLLIACLGFMIKKWVGDLEKKIDRICNELSQKIDRDEFKTFSKRCDEQCRIFLNHSHTVEGKLIIN